MAKVRDPVRIYATRRSGLYVLRIHDALFVLCNGIAPSYRGCTYTSPCDLPNFDENKSLPPMKLSKSLLEWITEELFLRGDDAWVEFDYRARMREQS